MATSSPYLDTVSLDLWGRECFSFIPDRVLAPAEGRVERGPGPRVIFTGFPSDYSLAFLLALLAADVELVGIITSPGAHEAILGDNALSQIAAHLDIPLLRLWRVNDEHAVRDIAALRPDGVVMASFDQIVGNRALSAASRGWLNIHPSLLPAYRGPEPVYWAIADGATETGITLHRAVSRVDAGPVLASAPVPITSADNAGTLTKRIVEAGVGLLPAAVRRLLSGDAGEPVALERGSYRGAVGHRPLDGAASAAAAERMVRAGFPNMLAWTADGGAPLYVTKAEVADCDGIASLRFPDGCLRLLSTGRTCACHHDEPECPHLER